MIHLSFEQEKKLIRGLCAALNVEEIDAHYLSEVVTHSDFTGTYSHGLSRLCIYLRQYMANALIPQPDFKLASDKDGALVFDCGGGSGIAAVNRVYDEVLKRAKKYGVAAGVGRNSANIGCGAYYGHRMAEDNMIGIVVSNTYPCGKVQAYRRENKEMPEGWANDYDGNPTTDPNVAYCVRPMGGHKGYGLAVFVDMFGGVLSDALTSPEIPFVEDMRPEETGFAVILLDIEHFINVERFKEHASLYASLIKNSRTATGVKEIFMPGEIEARLLEERKVTGVDFSDALEAELTELGKKCGALGPDGTLADLLA